MSDFPVEQESERLTLDEIAANLARIGRSGYGALPETPERFPESSHVDSKYWAELVRARRQIAESEVEVQQLRSALARQAIECSNARFDLLNQSRKERAAVEPEQDIRGRIAELLIRRADKEAPNAKEALRFMAGVVRSGDDLPESMLGAVPVEPETGTERRADR